MSENEALEYVDIMIETLVQWEVISETHYGQMTESQRTTLAEKIMEKANE